MKIFSIFYLLAGVSVAMPMANEDRDSSDTKMEEFMQLFEKSNEATKKVLEENRRVVEEANRQSAYLKMYYDKLKEITEKYNN